MEGYLNLKEFENLGLVRFYIPVDNSYLQFASKKEDFKLGNYGLPVIFSENFFGGKEKFDKKLERIKEVSIKVEMGVDINILVEIAKQAKKLEIVPGMTTTEELRRSVKQQNLKRKVNRILDPILKKYFRKFPFDYYL